MCPSSEQIAQSTIKQLAFGLVKLVLGSKRSQDARFAEDCGDCSQLSQTSQPREWHMHWAVITEITRYNYMYNNHCSVSDLYFSQCCKIESGVRVPLLEDQQDNHTLIK